MIESSNPVGTTTRRVLALITEAIDLLDAHGRDVEAVAYPALAQQKLRHGPFRDAS